MLAQRQWALLSAAFLLLKQGGFLVYATCALADAENDGVVQKLLKKYGNDVAVHSGTATSEWNTGATQTTDGSIPVVHSNAAAVGPNAVHTSTADANISDGNKANSNRADSTRASSNRTDKKSAPPMLGEQTLFGYRFLPDTCAGAGPLYVSLIEKREL